MGSGNGGSQRRASERPLRRRVTATARQPARARRSLNEPSPARGDHVAAGCKLCGRARRVPSQRPAPIRGHGPQGDAQANHDSRPMWYGILRGVRGGRSALGTAAAAAADGREQGAPPQRSVRGSPGGGAAGGALQPSWPAHTRTAAAATHHHVPDRCFRSSASICVSASTALTSVYSRHGFSCGVGRRGRRVYNWASVVDHNPSLATSRNATPLLSAATFDSRKRRHRCCCDASRCASRQRSDG